MQNIMESRINPATEQVAAPIVIPAIASFQFQNRPVRIVIKDGTEYFLAKDLAPILGFKNPRQAVRRHVSRKDRQGVTYRDTLGGNQTCLAVNESGLYALAFGSTKPEAKAFKSWVTATVLPTIRRTGRYEVEQQQFPALLGQITAMLRGRGVAKGRQLNRIVAHRAGDFSFRVGQRWIRHVQPLDVCGFPQSHSLREGIALSAIHVAQKAEQKALTH